MFGMIADVEKFAFYRIIMLYLREKIHTFGIDMMENFTTFVAGMALVVVTLWVMLQGWRIVSGGSRESMMGLVVNASRAAFITVVAMTTSVMGSDLHKFFTDDVNTAITELVTGSTKTAHEQIDENMALMTVAISAIDVIDTGGDQSLDQRKMHTKVLAGIGSGAPAIVAGSMLLLFEMAIALFVGFAPLFILCLLFDQTKSLFQRWLFYGLGTMFSMATLAFVTSMAMEMMATVAKAMWLTKGAGWLVGQQLEQGLSAQALQQGGLGLILTTLIVTTPPMAAMFFQGTLGSFTPYAAIGGGFGQGMSAPAGPSAGAGGAGPAGGGGGGNTAYSEPRTVDHFVSGRTQGAVTSHAAGSRGAAADAG